MRAASIPVRPRLGPFRSKRLLALAGDERLVEAIRRGNEAAFEVAFERHAPGILSFCRHMLGSVEEAEDAVQHSFAAAFRSLERDGERELALKPWLYAIARNRCVSVLRSRRDHVSLDTDIATATLAEHVERRTELGELLADLAELPDEQRAALLLAELGDLSHTQVAAVLGCEPSKVKALVFRARTGLIQRREARDTPCEEIREQLATLHGGSLRRNRLRHHLRACPGCRAYREQVKHQRRLLAAALPVVPSLGLKASVLGAIGLGGGSTGGGLVGLGGLGGLGGALSTSLGVSGAAKLAAVGVLAGGGLVAGGALIDDAAKQPGAAGQVAPAPGKERSVPAAPKEALVGPVADHARPERGLGPRAAPSGSKELAQTPTAGRTGHDRGRKVGHVKNVKRAPAATQTGTAQPGYGFGRQKRAAKPTPVPRGRGPAGAPPASTPVKRGPPQPKQHAQRATKAAASGPVRTTGPPEAHAPHQRKVKPTQDP